MTSTSDARAAGTATSVHDVAVVGAGPSGLAMAIALARSGLFTVLIAPDVTAEDDRTTALLDSSVEMLKSLDLWERILPHAAPLAHMRIIDGTERLFRAPETVFDASELKLEAFGCSDHFRVSARGSDVFFTVTVTITFDRSGRVKVTCCGLLQA